VPTLRESLLVAAPTKRVYGFLADIERVQEWLPYVVDARRTSENATGEGAEIALTVSAAGRTSEGTTRCIAATPSHHLAFETKLALGLTSTVTFDLAAEGRQQTQMNVTVEYGFTGLTGRLIGKLLGDAAARRDIVAGLEGLKARLEAEPARPARRRTTASAASSEATKR
jgi:carbon monoxide dehydrogenase subunit G